jgi:4-amino-4-deoxy-L-arabinose transferase-like glycosyltransferase
VALVAILSIGIWLRCRHMTDVQTRSPDEKTYTSYAARLADQGFGVYRELFATYDGNPAIWIYPSPTRFGHVALFSALMAATGVRDSRAGAAVSWLFSVLSLFLVTWIGLRFFNPAIALLATAFLAFSFGELGMARRDWQDSTFGFCGLLLVYFTCEITAAPTRKLWYPLFLATGTFAFLTKETSVLSFGFCALWLAATMLLRQRSWTMFAALLAGEAACLLLAFNVWIALAGNVGAALAAVDHSTRSGAGEWAKLYCSGPWYQFFYLLWIVGPLTASMATVGAVVGILANLPGLRKGLGQPGGPDSSWWDGPPGLSSARQRGFFRSLPSLRDARAIGMAVLMTLGFVCFAAFVPHLQYLRIVSPADGTYCLLAGTGFWYLLCLALRPFHGIGRQAVTAVAIAILVLAAFRDYRAFENVVVRSGMEELAVSGIRTVMGR